MNSPRRLLRLEPLESRRTPATLSADNMSVTYLDGDGDTVTVALSKPVLTAANKDAVFHFDVGSVDGVNTAPQVLQTLDLTGLPAGLKVTALGVDGDSKANVGWVNATGIDVGSVTISGDLGRVTAGNTNLTTPGLGTLAVGSLGLLGVTTQAGGGTLVSAINGNLTKLTVTGDVNEARVSVTGAIGSVSIGGKLTAHATNPDTGLIDATGAIGKVAITGGILGKGGDRSGIRAGGSIKSVSVGGLTGGGGIESAAIVSINGNVGPVLVTGDVVGGPGLRSASVRAPGHITQPNPNKPRIMTGGTITSVTVTGAVTGDGPQSAAVQAGRGVGKVDFGSLAGGSGGGSAAVTSQFGNLGPIIVHGAVQGGSGLQSASFHANGTDPGATVAPDADPTNLSYGDIIASGGKIKSIAITGIVTGTADGSAAMAALRSIGTVKLGGLIGNGIGSAAITSGLSGIGAVQVLGDVKGGTGAQSGSIRSGKSLGAVSITGDLRGGAGDYSGSLAAGTVPTDKTVENINKVTIGKSVVGGAGKFSAAITSAGGSIGPVLIKGDLTAGSGRSSASIQAAADYDFKLVLLGGKITSVAINGSVDGTASVGVAAIQADRGIGPVTIGQNWTAASIISGIVQAGSDGWFGNFDDAIIKVSPLGALFIGGTVEGTLSPNDDQFAFYCSTIAKFTLGNVKQPILPGPGNDVNIVLGTHGDFILNEASPTV